jgi:hypothetical protein
MHNRRPAAAPRRSHLTHGRTRMAMNAYEMTCLADRLLHDICEATTGKARKHADKAHAAIHELAHAIAQQNKPTVVSPPATWAQYWQRLKEKPELTATELIERMHTGG